MPSKSEVRAATIASNAPRPSPSKKAELDDVLQRWLKASKEKDDVSAQTPSMLPPGSAQTDILADTGNWFRDVIIRAHPGKPGVYEVLHKDGTLNERFTVTTRANGELVIAVRMKAGAIDDFGYDDDQPPSYQDDQDAYDAQYHYGNDYGNAPAEGAGSAVAPPQFRDTFSGNTPISSQPLTGANTHGRTPSWLRQSYVAGMNRDQLAGINEASQLGVFHEPNPVFSGDQARATARNEEAQKQREIERATLKYAQDNRTKLEPQVRIAKNHDKVTKAMLNPHNFVYKNRKHFENDYPTIIKYFSKKSMFMNKKIWTREDKELNNLSYDGWQAIVNKKFGRPKITLDDIVEFLATTNHNTAMQTGNDQMDSPAYRNTNTWGGDDYLFDDDMPVPNPEMGTKPKPQDWS